MRLMICIDSSSILALHLYIHELSLKKAQSSEDFEQNECKNYVPSYINWAIMIIRFDFFYGSIILSDHSLFFVPKY